MKRTFSTELAYVFGIVFVAWGVVLMEKADFGVSMAVAPAYLFRYTLGECPRGSAVPLPAYTVTAALPRGCERRIP